MPTIEFESLTKPVSPEEPCGPDLDLGGDLDYMNFVAGAEGLLPRSYFGKDQAGNEGRPFDRNSINFEAQFNAARPFLERTRDLRLLGILAKFHILNRDLVGFNTCIRAISALLSEHWDEVHPRSEDGDFGFRMVAIESIDALPTIIMPLQFLPLIEHKRLGSISYRSYMIAKGQLEPIEGEESITLPNLEKILNEVELSDLIDRRRQIMELQSALTQIRQVWQEKCSSGPSVSLERLPENAAQIFAMLNAAIVQRDPSASLAPAEKAPQVDEGAALDPSKADAAVSSVQIVSSAQAAAALAAVADYFSSREPSNPALLLVRQAIQLLGKSFLEVMRILVPSHVETAAINIGRDHFFDLPIERLATFAPEAGEQAANKGDDEATGQPQFTIQSRNEALALLEQVGAYFRVAEPPSPIPFLTERARDLAQRDFLSVLKSLLPPDTLKAADSEK
jgi:type VI secretion system protein ImpA